MLISIMRVVSCLQRRYSQLVACRSLSHRSPDFAQDCGWMPTLLKMQTDMGDMCGLLSTHASQPLLRLCLLGRRLQVEANLAAGADTGDVCGFLFVQDPLPHGVPAIGEDGQSEDPKWTLKWCELHGKQITTVSLFRAYTRTQTRVHARKRAETHTRTHDDLRARTRTQEIQRHADTRKTTRGRLAFATRCSTHMRTHARARTLTGGKEVASWHTQFLLFLTCSSPVHPSRGGCSVRVC